MAVNAPEASSHASASAPRLVTVSARLVILVVLAATSFVRLVMLVVLLATSPVRLLILVVLVATLSLVVFN